MSQQMPAFGHDTTQVSLQQWAEALPYGTSVQKCCSGFDIPLDAIGLGIFAPANNRLPDMWCLVNISQRPGFICPGFLQ